MPEESDSYYYVDGKRVPLQRQEGVIAVKYKDVGAEGTRTRGLAGPDVPGFEPPEEEDILPGGVMLLRQEEGRTRSLVDQDTQLQEINQRPDVEFASAVYEHSPGDAWVTTDQFLVQFKAEMSAFDIQAFNDQYQVEQVERLDWAPRTYLLRVTPLSPGDALAVANAYMESGQVEFAHPNFIRKYVHRVLLQPDPGKAACQWHLSAIQAFDAWNISTGSPAIQVAVIDDGVDVDHLAFANQADMHYNVVDMTNDPRPPAGKAKHYTHGTACAGLAVGSPSEEVGTSGVAPGCRLMAVRLLDRVIPAEVQSKLNTVLSGEDKLVLNRAISVVQPYREARAIQWAFENGADVISNSWGPPDGHGKYGKSYPIDDITRLVLGNAVAKGRNGKGCVVLWAAGNGNESITLDGYASHPDVLAVAACTLEGKRAPYSDYGPEVDVCAPGGGYSDGLLTTVAVDTKERKAYRFDFNGTSAATPIVAGIAALMLSTNPELTREEVYDILRSTAERIDEMDGAYDADGHSPYYGFGRVNAHRALEEAVNRRT